MTICDATRDIIEVRTGGYMSAAWPMIASLRSFNSRGSDLGMCACGEKCRGKVLFCENVFFSFSVFMGMTVLVYGYR